MNRIEPIGWSGDVFMRAFNAARATDQHGMKTTYELTESEIREAVREYVTKKKRLEAGLSTTVVLQVTQQEDYRGIATGHAVTAHADVDDRALDGKD